MTSANINSLFSLATQAEKIGIIAILILICMFLGWVVKKLADTIEARRNDKEEVLKIVQNHKEEILKILERDRDYQRDFLARASENLNRNTNAIEKLEKSFQLFFEFIKAREK